MIVVRALMVIASAMFCVSVAFAGNESDEKVECFAGSYVVGFKGRAGAWLDSVNVICAQWDAARGRLRAPGPAAGGLIGRSEGGDPTEALCPAGFAVASFHVDYTHGDDSDVVHHVDFDCKPVGIDGEVAHLTFGSTWDSELANSPPRKACVDGHLVTGIQGRGHFVEALDLLCGKAPGAVVASGPRGPYERHPPPVLRGKPAGGFGNAIETPPTPTVRVATAKNDVDIYQGPGEGDVLDILRKNETGIVLAQQDGWVKLHIEKLAQKQGWVAEDHLTVPPP